ncbi:hypothetical protein IB84_02370 [Vibrio cholerae]|nr:hypothetical protein IB84_02370 [Vibrio cholerae]
MPEYTEEDALADAQLEPAVESEVEPELELATEPAEEEAFPSLMSSICLSTPKKTLWRMRS